MMIQRRSAWLFTNHSPAEVFSRFATIKAEHDLLIAVDNGLQRVHELGLVPYLLIGDQDSLDPHLLQQYASTPRLAFPPDKNETDTELAIYWCRENGVREIVLCNDLEGRFDHVLGLVQNLYFIHEQGLTGRIESATQRVFFLDETNDLEDLEGCLLSLLAWDGEVLFKSSSGLQYPLADIHLTTLHPRGISNRITSSHASIRIASGKVLAILTK